MASLRERLPSPGVEHTWRRRLLHLTATSITAAIALILEYKIAVYVIAVVAAILASWDGIRLVMPAFNRGSIALLGPYMKPREMERPTAATYFGLSALVVLLLFGSTITGLAVLFLGLGDPVAGVVGSRYGRLRMKVWGRQQGSKSVEGTMAFMAAATAIALGLWAAGLYGTLWPALVGAAVAALVECLPLPFEDNFTVPLASGAVMWLLWVA